MKRSPLTALALLLCAPAAWARINTLEPWAPGSDHDIPQAPFNNSVNIRYGSGARGVDLTEISYAFTGPLTEEIEAGASWGFASLDSGGARDDSGLMDLTVAAKYRVTESIIAKPAKAIVEAGVTLPTGDPDNGLGAGGLGFFGAVGFSYPIQAVWAYARTGLRIYTEGSDTRWGRVIELSLGAEYAVASEFTVGGDLRIFDHGRDKIDGFRLPEKANEAYLAPGGTWRPANLPLAMQGALLIGLTNDAYDLGLLVGVHF